jgi:uncharacterized YccA/Bax inhibitor family protein
MRRIKGIRSWKIKWPELCSYLVALGLGVTLMWLYLKVLAWALWDIW